MAAEDFTTYTEVDPNSRVAVSAGAITVSAVGRNEDAYVYKDMGAGAITSFMVELQVNISNTGVGNGSFIVMWGASNNVQDFNGWTTYGISIWAYYNAGVYTFYVKDKNGTQSGGITFSANTNYYLRFARDNTTACLSVYSDAARTTVVGTNTIECTNTAYRYQYAFTTYNDGNALYMTATLTGATLDPATVGTLGSASMEFTDDGWEQTADSGVYNNYADFFRFGYYAAYGYGSGNLMCALPVPAGAKVIGAAVRLMRNVTRAFTTPITLYGIDEDNTALPADWAGRWGARTLTTANAPWTFPTGSDGGASMSPDFGAAMQEVVDRAGWASGNNFGLYLKNSTSAGDSTQYIRSTNHATASNRPYLFSLYRVAPAAGGIIVPVMGSQYRRRWAA